MFGLRVCRLETVRMKIVHTFGATEDQTLTGPAFQRYHSRRLCASNMGREYRLHRLGCGSRHCCPQPVMQKEITSTKSQTPNFTSRTQSHVCYQIL